MAYKRFVLCPNSTTTKLIDSGGGFLIEKEMVTEVSKEQQESMQPDAVAEDGLPLPVTYETCLDCSEKFADSYLFSNFEYKVCDLCRDSDEKHSLITRTEAKTQYLLKDCDLDKREPPLRFITRKNPHNVRWGEMKLYLHLQVEKRALEVWGSESAIEEELNMRDEKREKTKLKKFNKNMKQLRMEMRSSLYDRTSKGPHTHTYGEDTYHEDEDNYTHVCSICGFVETFEKMWAAIRQRGALDSIQWYFIRGLLSEAAEPTNHVMLIVLFVTNPNS